MAARKPQVGWRHPTADQDLFTDMFKLGYVKRIHLAPHGKVTEQWTNFVDDLFITQEAFMGKEKTTVRAVRQQWDARIESFKKTMGWEDGHCQNLSGFEGDLAEPDATIRMILNEIQEEEERKKVKENDAKQTEANEVQVILNGLTTTSKKRAYKQVGDSGGSKDSAGVPKSALKQSATSFIDHWMDTSLRSTPSLPYLTDNEALIEKVTRRLNRSDGGMDLIIDAYGDASLLPRREGWDFAEQAGILECLGNEALARLFVEFKDDPKYIKEELKSYGIDAVTTARLYNYIVKLVKEELTNVDERLTVA